MGGNVLCVQNEFKTGETVNMRTSREDRYILVYLNGSNGKAKGILSLVIGNRESLVSHRLVPPYPKKNPV